MKTWISAYLYYAEPWDVFLRKGVNPFVKKVLKEKLATGYFFIRYWERGPHIRLRFSGEQQALDEKLKPFITEHFESYFKQHPSSRVDPPGLETLPATQQWFPNNSVQFIPYEPEIQRYGGEMAISVAEQQFQASSDAVMGVMNDTWNYERALGTAIQMHLSFAHTLGMDIAETAEFYSYIFHSWLPMAYNGFAQGMSREKQIELQNEAIKAFEQQFVLQEAMLVPYHQMILEALNEKTDFEEDWLNKWIADTGIVYGHLKGLQDIGKIEYPDRYAFSKPFQTREERRQLWSIYASYVHMTNNRLGIQNRDEGYLGYLIMKSLECVC